MNVLSKWWSCRITFVYDDIQHKRKWNRNRKQFKNRHFFWIITLIRCKERQILEQIGDIFGFNCKIHINKSQIWMLWRNCPRICSILFRIFVLFFIFFLWFVHLINMIKRIENIQILSIECWSHFYKNNLLTPMCIIVILFRILIVMELMNFVIFVLVLSYKLVFCFVIEKSNWK